MIDHTATPWIYRDIKDVHAIAWVGKFGIFNKDGLSSKSWAEPELDAKRIVACVNACKGLETEWLESQWLLECKRLEDVLLQRDELLTALKRVRDDSQKPIVTLHGTVMVKFCYVDEAIDKVEATA